MASKILVPIDLADEHSWRAALPTAFAQAEASGAAVTVMTVVPDMLAGLDWRYAIRGEMQGSEEFDMHQLVADAEQRLNEIVRDYVPNGMRVETLARHGRVYDAVLDVADEIKADQIVITAHRPSVADYLLGSNAAKIVRHAKCSVNVVRNT